MQFTCCGNNFNNMPSYLEHLRNHSDNVNLYIKCNTCYQSCLNWESFKKHNYRHHQNNNPIELLNNYQSLLTSILSDDSTSIEAENVLAEPMNIDNETDVTEENILTLEIEQDNFQKSKLLYGQYLLEMTYKYKLTSNTVDDFNSYTKKLIVSFMDNFKVIKINKK